MKGIYSYQDLRTMGYSRRTIDRFTETGLLERVTRGWFATPDTDPTIKAAFGSGGRLTCISACRLLNLWIPPQEDVGLHIAFHPRRGNISPPKNAIIHRTLFPKHLPHLHISDVLIDLIRCRSPETVLIILESAICKKLVSFDEAWELIKHARKENRGTLRKLSAKSESGSETRVRLSLIQHKFSVKEQVQIAGVGRVDLLVGNTIIECDGRRYHIAESTFEQDHRRDLAAQHAGYRVIRLSYQQVWMDWARTQEMLLAILRTD